MSDVFDHMEEAWKLSHNPFPREAIRQQNAEQPYSETVFTKEETEFRKKFIRAGLRGGPTVGFLWSQGARADTGFGKTTLMQEIAKEINEDLGVTTLERSGAKKGVQPAIAAAFSNLNNLNATGLYPVLFHAVMDLATSHRDGSQSVFEQAYRRIVEKLSSAEPQAIESHVRDAWADIAGTSGPLRSELVHALATGGAATLKTELSNVSSTSRLRNGLQYLDFALGVLAAADIDHLFLMIDQLEDLATNRSVTAPKRSREIGRIRDLLEAAPYSTRLHMIFTFHARAAQALERFWEENRLPAFEVSDRNGAAVVVLHGLSDNEQTKDLLRVYLEDARIEETEDDILPFELGAIEALREASDGRPGILLSYAHEMLHAAAEQQLPTISKSFARQHFDGRGAEYPRDADTEVAGDDVDDLLLGRR